MATWCDDKLLVGGEQQTDVGAEVLRVLVDHDPADGRNGHSHADPGHETGQQQHAERLTGRHAE